jgi:hypothetical protein
MKKGEFEVALTDHELREVLAHCEKWKLGNIRRLCLELVALRDHVRLLSARVGHYESQFPKAWTSTELRLKQEWADRTASADVRMRNGET